MLSLAAAAFAQAILMQSAQSAAKPAKPAGQVGACAWGKLDSKDKAYVLAAYHQDRAKGLNALMDLDASQALAACAPGSRAPQVFLHRALWAEMTQAGAAQELSAIGMDRRAIEAAWTRSAPSAKLCLHNRLGPNFGEITPACADDAEGEIAKPLNIERADLRLQAAIYFIAKAEGEWAELLIANTPF
jgi:hypothetical protein